MQTTDIKSFNYLESGEITFSNLSTIKTTSKLDSGFYEVDYLEHPHYKVVIKKSDCIESIKTYDFPNKSMLDKYILAFFKKEVIEKVQNLGFIHKVGILLYGKEGTGKTSIIKYYAYNAIKEHNALVFYINNRQRLKEIWDFVRDVRKIQINPIIIIFDEIDNLLPDGKESLLKLIIDGNLTTNNTLFFACTNYIDNIPNALKYRPSRFKYTIDIEGIQNSKDIYDIIFKMIGDGFSKENLTEFSKQLVGQTLDEIKQFCLDKIMNIESSSNIIYKKVGFITK